MSNSIGLIGIGLLGQAIAERLSNAGFEVYGFDVREDLDRFTALGGIQCASAADVADQASRIILCLPDSNVAKQVVSNLEPHLGKHTLLDTTTGAPDDAVAMSRQLAKGGSRYLEANVAGSSEQMRARAATLLVGCSVEEFRSCVDVFDSLGKKTYYVGEVGNASRMKLVVNLAIGLNRAVLAESLAFGESLGFDSQQIADVLSNTPAHSAAMDAKAIKMVQGDFVPQARLRQHLKDVKLILDLARTNDAHVPLSSLHASLLESLVAAGDGELDNSAIVKAFRRSAGPAKGRL